MTVNMEELIVKLVEENYQLKEDISRLAIENATMKLMAYDDKSTNDYRYDKDGYDKDGYNKNGYNKDGYNKDGYDYLGYDKSGFNKHGYDIDGYDEDGWHKDY